MFDFLFPGYPCARRPMRQGSQIPDIDALIADGRLRIAPNVPEGVAEKIVADYFAGKWGKPKPAARIDYAAVGKYLLAAFEYGDTLYHVIVDHGHTITKIIQGE
jgi:hypothetical protein